MDNKNGFTLIELTIVLAIILIFSAATFAVFRDRDYRHINNASLSLQADLQYAQRRAIIEGRRIGLRFMEQGYIITYVDSFPLYYRVNHGIEATIRTVYFENNVFLFSINTADNLVAFLPRGTSMGGTAGTISLRAAGNRWQQDLTITPVAGRVYINEAVRRLP